MIELGLQHEQQHQELILTDMKHLLSLNPLHRPTRPAAPSASSSLLKPPAPRAGSNDGGTR